MLLSQAALTKAARCRRAARVAARAKPVGNLAARESARLRALFNALGGMSQVPLFPVGSPEGNRAAPDSMPEPGMNVAPEDRLVPEEDFTVCGSVPAKHAGAWRGNQSDHPPMRPPPPPTVARTTEAGRAKSVCSFCAPKRVALSVRVAGHPPRQHEVPVLPP